MPHALGAPLLYVVKTIELLAGAYRDVSQTIELLAGAYRDVSQRVRFPHAALLKTGILLTTRIYQPTLLTLQGHLS
jgi:hypothetical protein